MIDTTIAQLKAEQVRAVEIRAELRQIKTMADHSANITINVPEFCMEQVKVLLGWVGYEIGVVIANDADIKR